MPRNISVRPHQVSHRVMAFDASLRNYLYHFLQCCASSSNFIRSLQMSHAFYKSLFFPKCLTLLYGGDQLILLLTRCSTVHISSVLFLHNNEHPPVCCFKFQDNRLATVCMILIVGLHFPFEKNKLLGASNIRKMY